MAPPKRRIYERVGSVVGRERGWNISKQTDPIDFIFNLLIIYRKLLASPARLQEDNLPDWGERT